MMKVQLMGDLRSPIHNQMKGQQAYLLHFSSILLPGLISRLFMVRFQKVSSSVFCWVSSFQFLTKLFFFFFAFFLWKKMWFVISSSRSNLDTFLSSENNVALCYIKHLRLQNISFVFSYYFREHASYITLFRLSIFLAYFHSFGYSLTTIPWKYEYFWANPAISKCLDLSSVLFIQIVIIYLYLRWKNSKSSINWPQWEGYAKPSFRK